MKKILTVIMWTIIVLITMPILVGFGVFLVGFGVFLMVMLITITIYGLIYFIFAYILGTPISITRDGKKIGVLIRGKYYPAN